MSERPLPSHEETRAMIASLRPPPSLARRSSHVADDWEATLQRAVDESDAVVAPSSLMSFAPRITPEEKRDILLCHQLVQMLARQARARQATDDWFAYYKRRLQFLGWYELYLPGAGTSTSYLPADDISPYTLQAIDDIGAPGSGLNAPELDRLEADPNARRLLGHNSFMGDTGIYRFLPSVVRNNGMIESLLYQRHVNQAGTTSRALLFSKIQASQSIEERLSVLAFRQDYFERHRQQTLDTLRQQLENTLYPL